MTATKRKRGRKPGSSPGPNHRSVNWYLALLEVGERHYFETDADSYQTKQHALFSSAHHRQPDCMKDKRFTFRTFTAVGAAVIGDNRILICAERVK